MKQAILLSLILLYFPIISSAQNQQDDIVRLWDADKAQVEVYKSEDRYIGNPLDKEGQRVEQIEMLNLEFKDGKWVGKIYAKKRDRYFDVVGDVKGDKLHLTIDAGFKSKDVEWTRVR